jgi:hypothetical protein
LLFPSIAELLTPDYIYSGMRLIYLPPYSPDFNPIELAFSSIKAYLRVHADELQAAMTGRKADEPRVMAMLLRAMYSVTPEKARAWFRKCGYLP